MKKKIDRKIYISLIELLKIYDYEKLTITQMCQHAHISRQTFYTYYQNKDDVIKSFLDYILKERLLDKIDSDYFSSFEYVHYVVELYDLHDSFFIALEKWNILDYLSKDNQEIIKKLFKEKTKNEYIQKYSQYYYLSFFSSIHSICMEWIHSGKKETKKELEDIIMEFVFDGKDKNILK